MTDYLEEALEGLEGLIKRLRRTVPPMIAEEGNVRKFPDIRRELRNSFAENLNVDGNASEVYVSDFPVNRSINHIYDLAEGGTALHGAPGAGDGDMGRAADWQVGPAESRAGGKREPDSAAALRSGPPAAAWAAERDRPEETAGYAPVAALTAAGEAEWAEQADRAFRRDSRRYDGGFYLY